MIKININNIFVSVFGIGYIPFASGTFGSLAGLIIGYLIYLINYNLLILLIPLLLIAGIKASQIYQNKTGEKDSSVIVIDEVVGQLIAMLTVLDNLSPQIHGKDSLLYSRVKDICTFIKGDVRNKKD